MPAERPPGTRARCRPGRWVPALLSHSSASPARGTPNGCPAPPGRAFQVRGSCRVLEIPEVVLRPGRRHRARRGDSNRDSLSRHPAPRFFKRKAPEGSGIRSPEWARPGSAAREASLTSPSGGEVGQDRSSSGPRTRPHRPGRRLEGRVWGLRRILTKAEGRVASRGLEPCRDRHVLWKVGPQFPGRFP